MEQVKAPSLQKVEELNTNPPPAIVSLADSLLVATAMYQLRQEAVQAYQTKVLAEMQAHIAQKWIDLGMPDQVILDPKIAYLLDDDAASSYYAKCEQERIAAGLAVEKPGNCPELEAQALYMAARDAFIDALAPYTSITLDQSRMGLHTMEKLADWGLRILAKHVNPHKRFGITPPALPA